MTLIAFVVSFTLSFVIAGVLRRPLSSLMSESQFVAANYRGESIPKGVGVVIPLASFVPIVALQWFVPSHSITSLWLVLLFGMAFLGLFDDAAGTRRHGGFREHLRALINGEPTTGALKALYGGGLCLYAGWVLTGHLIGTMVSALLIALATNSVNLLDVRPGRALKGYALIAGAGLGGVIALESSLTESIVHIPVAAAIMGAAFALWHGDVTAQYMLGDAGSNVLGVAGGLLLAVGPFWWQLAWLGAFMTLHLVAEKSSLTEIIERVNFLDRLDRWGRS